MGSKGDRTPKELNDSWRTRADEFWRWFASVADQFGAAFENHLLIRELDARVARLGDLGWEIGPGAREPHALSLSPGGDREMLSHTRAIVSAAPSIPDWEFHPAKPPKEWTPVFEIQDDEGDAVEVDASEWTFVLVRYPDGSTEAMVEAANLGHVSPERRRWAAEIVLDGLLGEEKRLNDIDNVTVVDRLDDAMKMSAKPIAALARQTP